MGTRKRKKSNDGEVEVAPMVVERRGGGGEGVKEKKQRTLPSMIKNKEKRSTVHAKLKREKRIEKRKKAKAQEAALQRAFELGDEVSNNLFHPPSLCVFLLLWLFSKLLFS